MGVKSVLITGANGYLGAQLCLSLSDSGYDVTALCHSDRIINQDWVSKLKNLVIGDIKDEIFLNNLASKNSFDILIHLVSFDQIKSEDSPALVINTNVTPVWNLLNIFSNKNLHKFIYFSTMQVYGRDIGGNIDEKNPTNPSNAYALTHKIGEEICQYYNRVSTTKCISVRLSNSYGHPVFVDNNCWNLAINDFCRKAYYKNEIFLQSDGSPLRDFIHGNDVCLAIQKIIETNEIYSIYNLSSSNTISIMDVALKVKDVFQKRYKKELPILLSKTKTLPPAYYQLNNQLLRSIGFEQICSLDSGISNLFDFFERQDNKNLS